MEVLLKQDVENLGSAGDIVGVKAGFARNYLIPRGLAMPATPGLRKQADQIKQAAERRRLRELKTAQDLADRISQVTLNFKAMAGEGGRLYGSVTSAAIAEALSQELNVDVDRRRLRMEHSLRELGDHEISINLSHGVNATFKVIIEAEGELAKDTLTEDELEEAAVEQGVVTEPEKEEA